MEDAFLVGQVVSGNRVAFRMLVLRYQRPLFRFLGLLGFDAATVEDLAQQTFWRAYRALPRFAPEQAAFSTWLFTIAKRLAASEHQGAHRRFEVGEAGEAPRGEEPSALTASDALLAAERAVRVRGALAGLPKPLRSTFLLSQVEELSSRRSPRSKVVRLGRSSPAFIAHVPTCASRSNRRRHDGPLQRSPGEARARRKLDRRAAHARCGLRALSRGGG